MVKGIKNEELDNKPIFFGCDITASEDIVLDKACDITVDLNQKTYTNKVTVDKSGDFDFQHKDAILRIRNGKMTSTFCVFIFRTAGQIYGENLDITSNDEAFFQYGGHNAVINLKNCNVEIVGNYKSIALGGSCGGKGGTLYQIEGGRYDGLAIFCALPGSYVKDVVVYEKELFIDSWCSHGENGDVVVPFTNVTVDVQIKLNDVRVDPEFYDCTFTKAFTTRSQQKIVAYTSATCQKAGTKTTYEQETATVDEQYSLDHPAISHGSKITDCTRDVLCDMCNEVVVYEKQFDSHDKFVSAVAYGDGFSKVGVRTVNCKNCNCVNESEYALSIIEPLGYSVKEDKTGFGTGIRINKEAIALYEKLNNTSITFGIVVFNPKYADSESIFENGKIKADKGVIQIELSDSEYTDCAVMLDGFDASSGLELVFAVYAYDDNQNIQLFQKEYAKDGESPMVNKLTRSEATLYTVSLDAIAAPEVKGNKKDLDEWTL